MRILWLMQYFVPPTGAWSTRSYEFVRRLIANGHQVHVITSNGMLPEPYKDLTETTELEIDSIPCTVIPIPYATGMSFLARVKGYVRYMLSAFVHITRHSADLVYASSAPLTICIPGIWARLWHRIPMVFEVRDLWPEMPIVLGAIRNPVIIWLAKSLEWVAYHASARVVALSPGMAEGVALRGIKKKHIELIPNSCDIELFDIPAKQGNAIRDKLGLFSKQPLVVYVGSYGLLNNVDYMIDLAYHMQEIDPDIAFLAVGKGVNRDKLIEKARSLNVLEKNFWLWDAVPKKIVPDILAAATVVTSLFVPLKPMWKNSANKFFDALAAGKPIIINYGDWQADIINETGAGLVLSPDVSHDVACQLANFMRDTVQIEQASQASRELAHNRFDRDLMAEKLETLLLRVIEEQTL